MANFPEENEDGPSKPSLKRQRVSSTSGGFSAAIPNQETQQHLEYENQEATPQHQESENRETTHQHQPNENQETQEHLENENREITRQHLPNENQETQGHLENENLETTRQHQPNLENENRERTRQHQPNENQETQGHLENENRETTRQHQPYENQETQGHLENENRERTRQHQPNENQETQGHLENENRETTRQHQPNENQETQEHLENENRETTRQHQPNENQETQQHESNENQETQLHEANENEETRQHQENENQESSEDDEYLSDGGTETEQEDDVIDKLSGFLGDGAMSMTLMDLDTLDCAICLSPLTIPVFQCENGHTACSSCCSKLANKCPTCSFPIGDNRCRAIEKVLESVRIPCKNMRYGCGETFTYSKKLDHDKSCIYAPCSCPVQGCNFISSSKKLDTHLRCRHVGDVIRFEYGEAFPLPLTAGQNFEVLQETDDGAIFILHHHEETFGNVVTISCLGPPSSAGEYFYELSTGEYFYELSKNSQGKSFKFQSCMHSIQSRVDHPLSAGFVLTPGQFFGTSKMIYLDLIVWRKSDCPLNIQRSKNAD